MRTHTHTWNPPAGTRSLAEQKQASLTDQRSVIINKTLESSQTGATEAAGC